MTTRSDGSMRINVELGGEWRIACGVPVKDFPRTKPKASALPPMNALSGVNTFLNPAKPPISWI